MGHRKKYYICAYDIADPKRLRKVHQFFKTRGLPVQRSVFLVRAKQTTLQKWLHELQAIIQKNEDDIRAYPVFHPGNLWMVGGSLEVEPHGQKAENPSGFGAIWQWFRRKK